MGFVDARRLPAGHRIEADLCIIGSGAAGLAIAMRFLDASRSVAVLESGGLKPDAATQRLYEGHSIGQSHASLASSRLRYFGGTTNHWTAHVRTLDPIDFEERPWVPYSGWPIGLRDLAPYYEQARIVLDLPEGSFDPTHWQGAQRKPWAFEDRSIESKVRQVVAERKRRFGTRFRRAIGASQNVHTYLHANVLRIKLGEGRREVKELALSTLEGTRFTARARTYVLATGGIENPRILLLSDIGTNPDPERNIVGRFYANHPAADIAEIQLDAQQPDLSFYSRIKHARGTAIPLLRVSERTQRQHALLNTWLQPLPKSRRPRQNPHRGAQHDSQVAKLALDMHNMGAEGGTPEPSPGERRVVRAITEQAPNPASRVFLGDERDRFGQRRAVLDWQLNELDTSSVRRTVDVLTREMGIAGLGRVRSLFPAAGFSGVDARGSFHHMGTTRMHPDPGQGVVDSSCRVHGLSNLYVAGSSVFPTGGISNPTYTILALAFRLANHLKERV